MTKKEATVPRSPVEADSGAVPGCAHAWAHGGLRFRETSYRLPGSGACERKYYDLFYCTRCMTQVAYPLPYQDNTYGDVKFGASPISAEAEVRGE